MSKWSLAITLMAGSIACCLTSTTLAQTFFGTGTAANTPQAQAGTPTTNKPMTAEEFKNRVNTLSQQTLQSMNSAATPKSAPATIAPPTPKVEAPIITNTPSSASNAPANNAATAAPTTPATPVTAPANTQANTASSNPPTQPSETYTGFGTGNTNNTGAGTTNAPAPSNSSGWNIKY